MSNRKGITDALEILHATAGGDVELARVLEEERINAEVGREILALRTRRGLTQAQLAGRVGTTQSVIARLEAADYTGHSLRMLRRIAHGLDARLSVHLVPGDVERIDAAAERLNAEAEDVLGYQAPWPEGE